MLKVLCKFLWLSMLLLHIWCMLFKMTRVFELLIQSFYFLSGQIIIKMAAANGVRRVWVGKNTLMSTPAVSAVIRERSGADVRSLSLTSSL